jgi:hypothetical protein
MNECERIAAQLGRALHGNAWHGPSWKEVLKGVSLAQALHRPIPDAHTIAEIALHATSWHEIVRERLEGGTPEVTDARNFPDGNLRSEAQWKAVKARLFSSGDALRRTIAQFPPARLHRRRPRTRGTWYELAIGQLQHDLYHAGQVAVLRKAKRRARR